MIRFIVTFIAVVSVSTTIANAAGDFGRAQVIVNQVCAACHGVDGNSALSANPSLAGQHREYLLKQLTEFKSGARINPVMAGMIANLTPEDMSNLAAYYASQTPKRMAAKDADLAAQGRKIFRGGIASTGVAACAGCHSPNGAGIPAQYPRLSGQHADYIAMQLKAFRSGERANDLNQMMRATAVKLTDKEITALAEYISGLQ